MNLFSERLSAVIAEEFPGRTQKDLASAIGISEAALTNYLTKDRTPRIEEIEKIASFLNVRPGWLLGWDDLKGRHEKIMATAAAIAEASGQTEAERQEAFNKVTAALETMFTDLRASGSKDVREKLEKLGARE